MHSFSCIDGNTDPVDASDRGLAYGDGLFETMLAVDGRIRWLAYHLDRLGAGCRRLEIPAPARNELERELLRRVPQDGRFVVKLLLTRGSGSRGYAPPPEPLPVVIIQVSQAPDRSGMGQAETRAEILDLRLSENENLAGIKHLCRLEQVLAQLELRNRNAEEGVLLSRSGLVVGCTSANLFAVAGGAVATPAIRVAGICGVMRRVALEQCRKLGIECAEQDLSPTMLAEADELFLTNAVLGIRSIGWLDGVRVPSRSVAETLNRAIFGPGNADRR